MSVNINTPLLKMANKIQSIYSTLISTYRRDLLWTNPNPTSGFSAQTISLDLSGYDEVGFDYAWNTSTTTMFRTSGKIGETHRLFITGKANNNNGGRNVTVSANSVAFEDANYNGLANNEYVIPVRIYGIRKVIGGNANDIRDEFPRYNLDTTLASGVDHDLYAAITALGWENDVIE